MQLSLRGWCFLFVTMAVMSLLVTSPAPSGAADEMNDRTAATVEPAASIGPRPAVMVSTLEIVVGRSVPDEAPLESAIRTLLCLEAREAIRTGRPGREVLNWIMSSSHTCPDARLLFDTFGF